ncbi:MAG: hypothetical protein ABI051_01425 [Vicinamibacterales bacterium]
MARVTRLVAMASMVGVLVGGTASAARAQATPPRPATSAPARAAAAAAADEGFTVGYTDIGPVIGLGGIGDAGVSIGARFEHGFKQLPDLGNGILGIEASFDHYSYDYVGGGNGFSFTPIGVTVNYHFQLDNKKWDPFVGLGLGDYFVTKPDVCKAAGVSCSFNSGVYVIGRLGVRYFYRPNMAFYGDVGAGAGALHVGVMFNLKRR